MIKDTSGQDTVVEAKRNITKVIVIASIALILIAFATRAFFSTPSASRSYERATVQIARVEIGDLVRDIISNGRIVAANAPQVYSPEQAGPLQ